MPQARRPLDTFTRCPSCGFIEFQKYGENARRCRACNYTLYSNPASATAVFLLNENNEFLSVKRGREPSLGKWDIPGGFVDVGESLEDSAIREIKEEVDLEIKSLEYLTSFPNDYVYAGIKYATTDAYFISREFEGNIQSALGEVSGYSWLDVNEIDRNQLAFSSTKKAVDALRWYLKKL